MQIVRPKLESLTNPIGVDELKPRFSWQLRSNARMKAQSAYRISVYTGDKLVWDSGKVVSQASSQIEYAGEPLQARTQYRWQVRIWDERGIDIGVSREATFETGLMGRWRARWISSPKVYEPETPLGVATFLKEFSVKGNVESARLYVSALGAYAFEINGERAHDTRLAPGPSSTHKRVRYQAYDVSAFLREGTNTIRAGVAGGWYTGDYVHSLCADKCGKCQALIAQLHIRYQDGREETVHTDSHWKVECSGAYRMADLVMGVHYDATAQAETALNVYTPNISKLALHWQSAEPIRFRDEIAVQRMFKAPNGDTILDFGQNIAGVVKFRARGERGREIGYDCAETLDAQGNFYRDNYRSARAEVRYIMSGAENEEFIPDFTYMGFRYIRLKNWPKDAQSDDFTALVLGSDLESNAAFECSDERVNQLYQNTLWTLKSNLVGILTDAPERDERFGWTGNYHALARTLCVQMNAGNMLSDWMRDLEIEQRDNGAIPCAIPNCLSDDLSGAALSDDAVVAVPWALYTEYGDVRILEKHYPCIKKWMSYIAARVKDGIWPVDYQYGDWLALDARANSCIGITDVSLIATAAYARATELAARIAGVLDRDFDAKLFVALNKKIRRAYQREFITATGRLAVNTQTAHILTLQFELCEEEHRDRIARDLVTLIEENGDCLTTGSAGTPFAMQLLTDIGRHDIASKVLFRDDAPSWLYAIRRGATSMWERWDAIAPDGTLADPEFNSMNHPLGCVISEWLIQSVGGIHPYRQPMNSGMVLHPRFTAGLNFASAWQRTPFGMVSSGWQLSGTNAQADITVPVSCEALIVLENARLADVHEKGTELLNAVGILRAWEAEGNVYVKAASGDYEFSWKYTD